MSKFIFYDPNGYHSPLGADRDVLYLKCSPCLYQSVPISNHPVQVVCLCCLNISTIIDEVKRIRPSVSIYFCKEHAGRETTSNDNIRGGFVFSSDSDIDWKFEIQFDTMMENRDNGSRGEAVRKLNELIMSEQKSLSEPRKSVEARNQNENIFLNTSDEDAQNEETEETEETEY